MTSPTTSAPLEGIGRACKACSTDNAWNRKFCRVCGAKIVATCHKCDFGNALADLFCGGCGGEVSAPGVLPSGVLGSENAEARPRAARPPSPPKPVDRTARALARKLAALNTTNVQEPAKKPPPVPGKSGEGADPEDLGQEQIDALFG